MKKKVKALLRSHIIKAVVLVLLLEIVNVITCKKSYTLYQLAIIFIIATAASWIAEIFTFSFSSDPRKG